MSVAAGIPDRAFLYSLSIITARAVTVTDNAMITETIFSYKVPFCSGVNLYLYGLNAFLRS